MDGDLVWVLTVLMLFFRGPAGIGSAAFGSIGVALLYLASGLGSLVSLVLVLLLIAGFLLLWFGDSAQLELCISALSIHDRHSELRVVAPERYVALLSFILWFVSRLLIMSSLDAVSGIIAHRYVLSGLSTARNTVVKQMMNVSLQRTTTHLDFYALQVAAVIRGHLPGRFLVCHPQHTTRY